MSILCGKISNFKFDFYDIKDEKLADLMKLVGYCLRLMSIAKLHNDHTASLENYIGDFSLDAFQKYSSIYSN